MLFKNSQQKPHLCPNCPLLELSWVKKQGIRINAGPKKSSNYSVMISVYETNKLFTPIFYFQRWAGADTCGRV